MIDPALLETLPERERRQGRAELVKTSLLAGRELDVRGAAAFKTAVCLRDPHDHGPRAMLNLGHTFAHALEAAAGFELAHGDAVALGLLAALRLSGNDDALRTVEARAGAAGRVAVDRERAPRVALQPRDNEARCRRTAASRIVLLPRKRRALSGRRAPRRRRRRRSSRRAERRASG